jgi:hypothetical protein
VVVVNKTFKIPTVKSSGYNTDYIVILISVLCLNDRIYMDGVLLLVSLPNELLLFISTLQCTRT